LFAASILCLTLGDRLTPDLTDDNWKAVNSLPALPFLDSEYLPFFCGCFLGSIAIFGETKVM
jgi:hypothetical protein